MTRGGCQTKKGPRRRWMAGLLIAALAAGGCGGGETCKLAPVSGRVTLDGKPLGGAVLTFQPMRVGNSATGPGSFGQTDAEGRYKLRLVTSDKEGAMVGPHRVWISMARPDTSLKPYEDAPKSAQPLPPECRDGSLRCDVPADGTSTADFALRSL